MAPGNVPRPIDGDEVERLREEGAVVLEVLPRRQYDWAHIPGARHLPLDEIDERGVADFDRSRPVVVYCNDFL